jgi:uncharacterized protein (TIGR02001 family)
MNKLKLALLAALALPTLNVVAEEKAEEAKSDFSISYNMGLFSQYIFRGYTQTHNDPALQGGIDIEHSSGFYIGAWASNISWIRDRETDASYSDGGSIETDLYFGYANEIGDTGVSYDVGYLRYIYPGDRVPNYATPNTTELHVGLGYGWVDGKVHVVTSDDAWTWGRTAGTGDSARGTTYYDLNATIPIGELVGHPMLNGVTGILHYGYQHFAGANNNISSYGDWKLGLDKEFAGGINVGYYFTDTDARHCEGADCTNASGQSSWWVKTNGEYLADENHTFYITKSF